MPDEPTITADELREFLESLRKAPPSHGPIIPTQEEYDRHLGETVRACMFGLSADDLYADVLPINSGQNFIVVNMLVHICCELKQQELFPPTAGGKEEE